MACWPCMLDKDVQLMQVMHHIEGSAIWFTCCLLQCSLLLANAISVDDDGA